MSYESKTYENILQEQLDRIDDEYDKREGSMIQAALGAESLALQDIYMELQKIEQNAYGLTAIGQWLDLKVEEQGLIRKQATAAIGLGIFNVDIPMDSRFSTGNGAESIIFYPIEKISVGYYKMKAETVGTVGNGYIGSLLAVSFVKGLTSAELSEILIPGNDEETDESLRTRYVETLNQKSFGGNVAAYKNEILEIPSIQAVQIYPVWDGGGTVKCSILQVGYEPATQTLVDTVKKMIDPIDLTGQGYGLAPIGAKVSITTPEVVTINVSATITLITGYVKNQLQEFIETALSNYILEIRKSWGETVKNYNQWVFAAHITAAILSVTGVINVTNVRLNGVSHDIQLEETGLLQQIPKLGTVTLNA